MKTQNIILTISLAGLILSACTNSSNNQESKKEIVIERVSFQKTPLDPVYNLIRPSVQSFNIKASETQKILGENGTEILIPANSFIDGFGKLVSGNVEIEVIEASGLTDFITCNLQTLSNDNLLESAGMIFIDAKSNSKSLRIADGQKISISMPMMKTGEGFQMFIGKRDDDGALNWIEDKSVDKNYLIPFPSDVLYTQHGTGWGGWYGREYGYWNSSLDSIKFNPSNEEYNNTLIQTREFRDRIWKIYLSTSLISTLMNQDLKREEHDKIKFDDRLFDLYYSNLNTDIQILDSMANQIVSDFIDSPEFNDWLESDKSDQNGYYYYWNDDFDTEKYKTLLDFGSDGAKGNVPKLMDYGVDLLSDNAYDELINKGANQDEALMMINFEQERSRYLDEIKREKELREKKDKMQKFVRETVFSTSELGWINCDRFSNDPTAGKAEITVTIQSDTDLDYTDCSLVIPDLNVKLGAYAHGKSDYTFTKKDGIYTNLPLGKDALIIGVAFEDGKCYFSNTKIKIEDGIVVTLKMEQVDKSELKGKLEKLLSSNNNEA